MAPSFNKISHYVKKVQAIGIARSLRTVQFKVRSRMKGGSHELPSFLLEKLKAPDRLPFEINYSPELIKEADTILQAAPIDWHDTARDIRLVWEPARFQHLPILAAAYTKTGDARYLEKYKLLVISWLDAQQTQRPIYWYNGMEVGLRAINWTMSLVMLSSALEKDQNLYARMMESLQVHRDFIARHWEWYDGRTNNHYLSNIVGYAYLSWFFGDTKALQWCGRELEREFAWQVFDEGTSYEGSTRYHVLVTELFVHGFLVTNNFFEREKLRRMLLFIERCKPAPDIPPIIIGDDDSGTVLHPSLISLPNLAQQLGIDTSWAPQEIYGLHEYSYFGISLSRTNDWHIALRHHAYHPRQPSAHFHHDAGSITLAYRGQPILIDPGSYIYSSDPAWRNFFRAPEQHNRIYSTDQLAEPDLFALTIDQAQAILNQRLATVFSAGSARINREIMVGKQSVAISDKITAPARTELGINFIFDPAITLKKEGDGWQIILPDGTALFMRTTFDCTIIKSWYAPFYGVKKETLALRALFTVEEGREYRTIFLK